MLTQPKLQMKIKTNPLWDEMEMSAQGGICSQQVANG